MIDGIDGSGKSTVIQAWKDYLAGEGNAIFDLKHYWQTAGKYPDFGELKSYDFVFSCEPTFAGMGKVIREELIKNGTNYPPRAIAEAYSLDRLILYNKIIIPLLEDKKMVIQDRGVCTSLAYQTSQTAELNFEKVSNLPGNALALKYRPDYLALMKIKPENALKRIQSRLEKKDDAIFEKLDFLKKLEEKYNSEEYKKFFTEKGCKVVYLNAEPEIGIMKQEAVSFLKKIL